MITAWAFPLPKTRAEAIATGNKPQRFFTGKPCKQGHVAPRLRSSGTCVLCHNKTVSNWQKNNVESCRARQNKYRRVRLGIPVAPYPAPGICECCGGPPGKHSMHIDHDHASGTFRGWICNKCNGGLGLLGDSIAGLERAISYLKRSS